jgi:multiple sugar transport system substrate-binding protein
MTRNDGGVQYFGFGLHVNVLQVNDKAPQFINPQTQAATLNNDYWKKMFDRWLPLLNIASSAEDRAKMAAYPYDQFKKERTIGMIVANSSAWGFNKNVEGQPLNFDIAQFPTFKDLPNAGPPANPFYYLVSKTSPDREAVFNVLKYRSSEEMLQHYARIGKIVALKDRKWLNEFGKEEPLLQSVNAKSVIPKQYGDVIVNNIYGAQAVSAMNGQFAEVVKGTKDVNTALRDAEEAANKKIAELKAR